MGAAEPDQPTPAQLNDRGIELAERGEYAAAEKWFRRAAETGSRDAWLNLGRLLTLLDRTADALAAYAEAGRLGAAEGFLLSGDLLHAEFGDVERAKTAYRKAIAMGDVDAWVNLGVTLESEGDLDDARAAYESAVQLGDRAANLQLAELLMRQDGDPAVIEHAYREAVAAGEDRALLGIGELLRERRPTDAEYFLRLAVQREVEGAHCALGILFEAQHLDTAAEATYREGMAHGDGQAARSLGDLLSVSDEAEAEVVYREAIELGELEAHNNLGALFRDLDREDEAEIEFKAGATAGDPLAARNYAQLLIDADRVEEAEVALEVAVLGGDEAAAQMLAELRES